MQSTSSSEIPNATLRPTRGEWVFFFVAGALWGLLRLAQSQIVDDAFITFTYARNLVSGTGFVFNPGENVLGTTVPLFAWFVALGIQIGFTPWGWVIGWDVLLGFGILWRMRQIMVAAGGVRWFPAAAFLVVVASPMTLPTPGMETGWYCLFIFSALAGVVSGAAPVIPIAWTTAAMLLRPDGVFLAAVVLPWVAVPLIRRGEWKRLAMASLPLLAIPVFALILYAHFGDFMAHSVRAKSLTRGFRPRQELLAFVFPREHFVMYSRPHIVGWFAVLGMAMCARYRLILPVLAFYAVYYGGFALSRAPIDFVWYRVPLYQLMFLFAGYGIGRLADWRMAGFSKIYADPEAVLRRFSAGSILVVALLLSLPQAYIHGIILARELHSLSIGTNYKQFRKCAQYLNEHASADGVVAAYEIGTLRYFLKDNRVFDLAGLVTPQILEEYRRNRDFDRLEFSGAEWFVHPYWSFEMQNTRVLIEKDIARHGYHIAKEYHWPEYGGSTVIYRKSRGDRPAES